MDKVEFDKLTNGSIVRLKSMHQFIGEVLAVKDNTNGYSVYVDFPPNNMTHGGDPAPTWMHYESLEVVEYAKNKTEIPEFIKTTMQHIATNLETIQAELANCRRQFEI